MFKKDRVQDLLVALESDLAGDPVAEMHRKMAALARFPEVQETETGQAFAAKLRARDTSPEFMQALVEYMDRFGSRCTREIDVAVPRPYQDLPAFFEQLKTLDLEDDAPARATKRRQEAYERLLLLAGERGKAAEFERQANLLNNAGYRQAPAHLIAIAIDLMRRRALALGREFVAQGRLDQVTQIFDLNVEQITRAQAQATLPLLPLVRQNLAPRARVAGVTEWPRIIDSRGTIIHDRPSVD